MQLLSKLKSMGKRAKTRYDLLGISLFLSLLSSLLEALSVALIAPFLEYFITRENTALSGLLGSFFSIGFFSEDQFLFWIAVFIVLSVILKNVFRYLSGIIFSYAMGMVNHNLRSNIVARFIESDYLFFMRPIGQLRYQVGSGSSYSSIISSIYGLLSSSFMALSYLGLLFYFSPKLSLFALLLAPLAYFILSWASKRVSKFAKRGVKLSSDLSETMSALFLNAQLIKSYGTEKLEAEHYKEQSDAARANSFDQAKVSHVVPLIQEPLIITLVFIFGGIAILYFIDSFKGGVAGFLTYFLVLKRLEFMANGLLSTAVGIIAHIPSINLYSKAYNSARRKYKAGKRKFTGIKRSIAFKGVSFAYNSKEVLSNISFTIKRKQVVVIVGHTGSGKSTVLLMLNRLLKPDKGKILIDGKDIWQYDDDSFREKIAVVSQESLALHRSIRENLTYGSTEDSSDEKIWEALSAVGLDEKIRSLPDGLDSILDEHAKNFSGGQRQKLSLARAMVHQGDLVLLDEATSALDMKAERLVDQRVTEVFKGKTIFIVDHRLTFASQADVIIVMEQGKIAEVGSFKQLTKTKGKFWSYWQLRR